MSIKRTVLFALALVCAFSLISMPAHAGNRWISINPSHILSPVQVGGNIGSGGFHFQPSPVPSVPTIHVSGNGWFAHTVNAANDWAQAPKNWIDQKGREINKGVIHLGNEIGMLFAHMVDNVVQKAKSVLQWLVNLLMPYAIMAFLGLGVLLVAPPILTAWLVKRGEKKRSACQSTSAPSRLRSAIAQKPLHPGRLLTW
jgi:hypothetical protein